VTGPAGPGPDRDNAPGLAPKPAPGKRCIGPYGRVLLLAEFHRDPRARDGRVTRCRDCAGAASRDRRAPYRAAVLAHYGQACACCGSTERLGIDHVNGGGEEHRRRLRRRGSTFHAWLIAQGFPPGYQVLCLPCNQSKRDGPACRLYHGDPDKRQCTGPCGQVKPLTEFTRRAASRDGYEHRCRDCRKARWAA
jgi:hypothetical protein